MPATGDMPDVRASLDRLASYLRTVRRVLDAERRQIVGCDDKYEFMRTLSESIGLAAIQARLIRKRLDSAPPREPDRPSIN